MIVERPMQSESEMSRRDLLIDETRATAATGTDPLGSSMSCQWIQLTSGAVYGPVRTVLWADGGCGLL